MSDYMEDCVAERDIADMVVSLDEDGDGQIGLEEFIKMLDNDEGEE